MFFDWNNGVFIELTSYMTMVFASSMCIYGLCNCASLYFLLRSFQQNFILLYSYLDLQYREKSSCLFNFFTVLFLKSRQRWRRSFENLENYSELYFKAKCHKHLFLQKSKLTFFFCVREFLTTMDEEALDISLFYFYEQKSFSFVGICIWRLYLYKICVSCVCACARFNSFLLLRKRTGLY